MSLEQTALEDVIKRVSTLEGDIKIITAKLLELIDVVNANCAAIEELKGNKEWGDIIG